MFIYRRAFLLLTVVLFSNLALAQLNTTCGGRPDLNGMRFCINQTAGSTNRDILYVLHGGGGSEREWARGNSTYRSIRDTWQADGYAAPIVVEISFGTLWLLVPRNSKPKSGLFEVFTQSVIPYIENELLNGEVGSRRVFGLSMGGANTSGLMMQAPAMFKSAVIACPALLGISPFSDQRTIDEYTADRGLSPFMTALVVNTAKDYVPDDQTWNQVSPLIAGPQMLGPQTPPLHISSGNRDGFFKDDKQFADLAIAAGVSVTWEPVVGGHCTMDAQAIAQFIEHH